MTFCPGYAQDSPEEPSWTAPAATSPDSPDAADPGGAEPTPAAKSPPPLPASILEPADSTLGVPTDSGWGLPDFSTSESWFEVEGLRLRAGPLQIRFALDLNSGYNDNIFGSNTPKIGDYITTISPTITLGLGRYPRPGLAIPEDDKANFFSLIYTPSFQYFAIHPTQNAVNENLSITSRYTFSRVVLDGNLSYVKTTNPTPAGVGRQEYSTYSLSLKGSYFLSSKTFLQTTLAASFQEYANSPDSQSSTVSIAPALGYVVGPKLKLTLGPVAGITYVGDGGEQPFQAVQLGFTYDTLRKVQIHGTLGIQATQFEGTDSSGSENFANPIFALGVAYTINSTSSAALDLNRSVSTAGTSNGQTYISTTLTLAYKKRFLERIQLDLSASYQSLDYQGVGSRTDTYTFGTIKLGYLFWQSRCNTYVTYTRTQRFSEISSFEYDANFLGAGIDVQF